MKRSIALALLAIGSVVLVPLSVTADDSGHSARVQVLDSFEPVADLAFVDDHLVALSRVGDDVWFFRLESSGRLVEQMHLSFVNARRVTSRAVLAGDEVRRLVSEALLFQRAEISDIEHLGQELIIAHENLEYFVSPEGPTEQISVGAGRPYVLAPYSARGVFAAWGPPYDRIEVFVDGGGADLFLVHERTVTIYNPADEPIMGIAEGPNGGLIVAFPLDVILFDSSGTPVTALVSAREQRTLGSLTTDRCGSLYVSERGQEDFPSRILKAVPSYRDTGCFLDVGPAELFVQSIHWLGREGITKGCNPPLHDFFCPAQPVTRGQMAAFLVRALGYTDDGGGDLFVDDDGHLFENDIDKLSTAGVTRGCNPPNNDRFCPDELVTRAEMSAFLVRALGYTDNGGGDLFIDDDGSIFENDIDKLGTAGVTTGCNPPTNDRFCPGDVVTREQMAAFLHRALG